MIYDKVGESSSSSSGSRLQQQLDNRKGKYPANQNTQEESSPLLGSSSSQPYGTVLSDDEENDRPSRQRPRSEKTCTYIAILITASSMLLLFILLWFAPTFAERVVQDSVEFSFQKASILNVTQDNIMTMHVMGEVQLQPRLFSLQKKFNRWFGQIGTEVSQLDVYYQKDAMGKIDLPSLELNSSSEVTGFDFITEFVIEDTDALIEFCKDAVVAEIVLWRVSGPLSLNLAWLPMTQVTLDKTVAIEGMNGLQKTDMKSMVFTGTHPLGGVALSATVGIFNPSSVLSLTLGDMDFGIYLPATDPNQKDVQIAVVQALDADLQGHRMNYFDVTGRTLPITGYGKELMEDFITSYMHGNTTLVHVRGSSFGPDDQANKKHVSQIPLWLRKALEQVLITVPFPGATETDLIQSLQLSHIKIDFSSTGSPLITGDAVAILKKPQEMQFHMDVTEIDPLVFLYLNLDSEKPFASVRSNKPCPAKSVDGDGIDIPLGMMKVTARLSRAPFHVLPGGQKDFEEFLNRVFKQKKGKVYMRGKSDAKVESAFGDLSIRDLEFNGEIETQGLNGMKDPAPKVTSMKLVKGYQDALQVETTLSIFSPSDVYMNLGQLNMMLLFNGHLIGNTTIPELSLDPGVDNKLTVSAWLFGENKHVIDFIGQYISSGMVSTSHNLTLTISGQHPNASQSEFLNEFLQNLTFDVEAPEFTEAPLLADCQMSILSSAVVMSLRNPFEGILMRINNINATATYQEYELGRLTADFEDRGEGWHGPLLLPPPVCDEEMCKSITVDSEKIPIITKKLGYEAIKKALGGSIMVSVDSKVGVMIDRFELNDLQYQQANITAKVRKGFLK